MNLKNLSGIIETLPRYRATQIKDAIYAKLIESWDEATNLPKELRETLAREVPLKIDAKFFESRDGHTIKALIFLEDGERIESVLMRHNEGRNTVCVSTQVGCPMACDFCATGKLGLKRNLTAQEIVDQVLVFARKLKKEKARVSNVVFMGMGEPMLNYENVIAAIKILNDEKGLNIGARKISVSTCGLVPGIEKFADEDLQINLAISLHAPNDEARNKIMPVNTSYSMEKLLTAVSKYIKKTGRKVMIEYILLRGVNDLEMDAKELAGVLKTALGKLFMVNLILYNFTDGKYRASDLESKEAFREILEDAGIEVTQRYRMGHDIEGACGQLAAKTK